MNTTLEKLSPWLFTVLLFVLWELACRLFKIDKFILPAPSEIFAAMAQHWKPLLRHSLVTLWTTMAGFAIAVAFGIVLGLVVGWSRTIYRGLYPVMIGFNSIPKVAIVPILVVWFGIGEVPAILTAFLISFFPIVVDTIVGLRSIDPAMVQLARSMGAPPYRIFLRLRLPNALPSVFAGLKVASTLAVVGALTGEFIGSDRGLGYVLLQSSAQLNTPLLFATLVTLSLLAMAFFFVVERVERLLIPWHVSQRARPS